MSNDWGSDAIGVVLLAIGLFLMLRFRKRQFDRTNASVSSSFWSYWAKIGAKTKDAVLGGSSVFLLCSGVLVLTFNHVDSWGWIVVLPVLAFMLFLLLGN